MSKFPKFKPKEEYTKIPFDPNIRLRIPEFTEKETYLQLFGETPNEEP